MVFFPTSHHGDRNNNCRPGTVVDSDVVNPVEFDYYLYGHAGLLGTSKPAHYNVLVDENNFTYVAFPIQLSSTDANGVCLLVLSNA